MLLYRPEPWCLLSKWPPAAPRPATSPLVPGPITTAGRAKDAIEIAADFAASMTAICLLLDRDTGSKFQARSIAAEPTLLLSVLDWANAGSAGRGAGVDALALGGSGDGVGGAARVWTSKRQTTGGGAAVAAALPSSMGDGVTERMAEERFCRSWRLLLLSGDVMPRMSGFRFWLPLGLPYSDVLPLLRKLKRSAGGEEVCPCSIKLRRSTESACKRPRRLPLRPPLPLWPLPRWLLPFRERLSYMSRLSVLRTCMIWQRC